MCQADSIFAHNSEFLSPSNLKHLGLSNKSHTLIILRYNVAINSYFPSAVLHHSQSSTSVPRPYLHTLERTKTQGEGVALKSCAESGEAEQERRCWCCAGAPSRSMGSVSTKPPHTPPSRASLLLLTGFSAIRVGCHSHHLAVINPALS